MRGPSMSVVRASMPASEIPGRKGDIGDILRWRASNGHDVRWVLGRRT
jgi:hypothetical protein